MAILCWAAKNSLRGTLKVPKKVLGKTFIKGAKPDDSISQSYVLVTFS
jgi:hypothetical protein